MTSLFRVQHAASIQSHLARTVASQSPWSNERVNGPVLLIEETPCNHRAHEILIFTLDLVWKIVTHHGERKLDGLKLISSCRAGSSTFPKTDSATCGSLVARIYRNPVQVGFLRPNALVKLIVLRRSNSSILRSPMTLPKSEISECSLDDEDMLS